MGIFHKTLKRYHTSRRIPPQAFQLATLMRWRLGVRSMRTPRGLWHSGGPSARGVLLHTQSPSQCGARVVRPAPKGDALRDGGALGSAHLGKNTVCIPLPLQASLPCAR